MNTALQAKLAQLKTLRQGTINWFVLVEEILADILAEVVPTPTPAPAPTTAVKD